jgi:hypothetical protein
MYLHISRRSHSHTWGQQSSGVVSQEIHIKRLLVRCAVMSECILRDLWHHFTHYSVCMHQVRECLCVCAPRALIAPLRAPLISFLARSYILLKLRIFCSSRSPVARSRHSYCCIPLDVERDDMATRDSVAHILTRSHSLTHLCIMISPSRLGKWQLLLLPMRRCCLRRQV